MVDLIQLRHAFGDERYASFKLFLESYHENVGLDKLSPSLKDLCDLFCIETYAPADGVSFRSAMALLKHISDFHGMLVPVFIEALDRTWFEQLSVKQRDELLQAVTKQSPENAQLFADHCFLEIEAAASSQKAAIPSSWVNCSFV